MSGRAARAARAAKLRKLKTLTQLLKKVYAEMFEKQGQLMREWETYMVNEGKRLRDE